MPEEARNLLINFIGLFLEASTNKTCTIIVISIIAGISIYTPVKLYCL